MTPGNRKIVLTAHIVVALGWLGAVAGFLALGIGGLTSQDPEVIRGNYLAMDQISRFVVIPLSLATLATGLFQALAGQWGLVKHYWILLKLSLAVFAVAALLMHQFGPISEAARNVAGATPDTLLGPRLLSLKVDLVRAPALAIVLLLTTASLGVFKPWGLTAYGKRRQQEKLKLPQQPAGQMPLGLKIFFAVMGILVATFVALHVTGHGFHH